VTTTLDRNARVPGLPRDVCDPGEKALTGIAAWIGLKTFGDWSRWNSAEDAKTDAEKDAGRRML
jgi:hypothetical protein